MEQCFGAENVNKDDDASWNSCSVEGAKENEASPVLDKLPGCNPIQSGPADATAASGPNCGATVAPAPSGSKNSAGVSSPAVTSSAKASSKAIYQVQASASSAKKDDLPLLSMVNGVYGGKEAAKPTPASAQDSLPSLSLATTAVPAASTGKLSSGESNGEKGDCKTPVYVTVTPTIFVTAGVNSTSCGLGTVTKTLTETATVTVGAYGGVDYESY